MAQALSCLAQYPLRPVYGLVLLAQLGAFAKERLRVRLSSPPFGGENRTDSRNRDLWARYSLTYLAAAFVAALVGGEGALDRI